MRIVSKFCAFTVHETPTKDLWRFVKYYSQFSSDEFYLLFLRKFSWLMHNGFVWFLHCILYLGWQSKARKRENVGKCTSLQVCFECIFSSKDRRKAKRKEILFLHVKCGAHANVTANPNVNEAKYSPAFMRKVFHRFSWCFVSYFHLYSILVLFRAAFFSLFLLVFVFLLLRCFKNPP